jgi:hypothetical protein
MYFEMYRSWKLSQLLKDLMLNSVQVCCPALSVHVQLQFQVGVTHLQLETALLLKLTLVVGPEYELQHRQWNKSKNPQGMGM